MADSDNNKKTSFRIEEQLPLFVREDHPQFKNLLEVYYKFMESVESGGTRNALSAARNIADLLDIDHTDTAILNEFRRQFYSSLPENSVVDIKLFEKNIIDFYRAKGSERAFEFLFKIVFGIQKIEFRYPKVELLKASSGIWVEEKSIHVQTGTVGLENLITKKIVGSISGATAIVVKIEGRLVGQISISELYLKDILGTFLVSEVISDEDREFQGEVLLGILDKVNIDNPGRGYVVGDPADIINGPAGIIEVSETTNNQVITININDGGSGYELGSEILITPAVGDSTGADAQALITQINFNNFITRDLQVIGPFRNVKLDDVIGADRRIIGVSGNSNPKVMYDDGDEILVGGVLIGSTTINNLTGYTSSGGSTITGGDTIEEQFGVAYQVIDSGDTPRWSIGDIKYEQSLLTTNSTLTVGSSTVSDVQILEALEFRTYSVGVISELKIVNFGDNYTQIPIVTAKNLFTPDEQILGNNAVLNIDSLGGGVIDATIIDPGAGYFGPPEIVFPNSRLDNTTVANTANGTVSIQPLRSYEGRYEGSDGQLSSDKVLQDNLFFQDYSYVLQTDRSISDYRDIVKELLHPSGMELFGEVNIENDLDVSLFSSSNGSAQEFADNVSSQQGFILNLDDPDQFITQGRTGILTDPDPIDTRMVQYNATNELTHIGDTNPKFVGRVLGSTIFITLPGDLGFGFKGPPALSGGIEYGRFVAKRPLVDFYGANTISGGSNDAVWDGGTANTGGPFMNFRDLIIGDVAGEEATGFVDDHATGNFVDEIIELGGLLPANFSVVDSDPRTVGQFKLVKFTTATGALRVHFAPYYSDPARTIVITVEEFRNDIDNSTSEYSANIVSIADRDLVRSGVLSGSLKLEDIGIGTDPTVFNGQMVIQRIT